MKMTIAGAEYSVRFQHFTPTKYETVMQDPVPNGCKAVTLCRVAVFDPWVDHDGDWRE